MTTTKLPSVSMRPEVITGDTNMGRVVITAKMQNLGDLYAVQQGSMKAEDVRTMEVVDALVDTGCTLVGLPTRYIRLLGLQPQYRRPIRGATGQGETTVYAAVRLTIQDRTCTTDVFEVPDELPVLIGQVPLEQLDFIVDPKAQKLLGNPAHGGEHVIECY
jgi:predicted aspartyl protease